MKSPICDMLGIEFPLLAFSHCRDVVAAVSRAGGFGVLGCAAHSAETIEQELSWIDTHVGGKPYGLDVLIPENLATAGERDVTYNSLERRLPPQHRHLLPQHHQLGVLRRRRTCQQHHPACQADEHQVQHAHGHKLAMLPAP